MSDVKPSTPPTYAELLAKFEQLEAENQRLKINASRYLYLRSVGGKTFSDPLPGMPAKDVLYDMAVDALMSRDKWPR